MNKKEYNKQYYLKNKDKIRKMHKVYYIDNKDEILSKVSVYGKKYREENKSKISKRHKNWYYENIERIKSKHRDDYINNPEKFKAYARVNRKNNKENRKKYNRDYYHNVISKDPIKKLRRVVGSAVNLSLNGSKNFKKWQDLLGYSVDDLKLHIESKFLDGMTWGNYGLYGWHIDHIKPIKLFDFKSYYDKEFKECWSLDNLQPLWAKDNLTKSSKY